MTVPPGSRTYLPASWRRAAPGARSAWRRAAPRLFLAWLALSAAVHIARKIGEGFA